MNFRLLPLVAITALILTLTACGGGSGASDSSSSNGEDRPFPEIEKAAKDTKVNLSMYGGDDAINAYIDDYVIPELKKQHDIELTRTPLNDTADAINKLLNEKQAGKNKGTIDLVWLNGENFATGADADLWYGPWAEKLPNAKYIDWESPSINRDFGYPVKGREAPWGKAQFVMVYDSDKVKKPPKTMEELRQWTVDNPGRFTYPAPPDFTGNAFTEQVFYGVTGGPEPYQKPFDGDVFEEKAPAFSEFLNEIEPDLWREGETYPETSTKLDELYQNGEVWLTMSYNPLLAQRQISKGFFPESTRTYLFEAGTLNNTHYLAIPSNSPNKAGAQVVANFLQSPEAQIEKQDPDGWGDLTALSVDRLPKDAKKKLSQPEGKATLSTQELEENRVPEARSEWLLAIEDEWREKVLKE